MKSIYFTLLALFILNGCSFKVGGDCKYQKTVGKALIKSIGKNRCIVDFNTMQNIEAQCIGAVVAGEAYCAVYKKATHGSCTPYFLTVYHDDIKNVETKELSCKLQSF